jgi:lipase
MQVPNRREAGQVRSQQVQTNIAVNGVDLAVWEWAGADPCIVLCHATGFHGRCWDQIVARLPESHCIALDFRGHGRSSKPSPPYSWRWFGEDLAALLGEMQVRDAIGAGHSMGGHAVALAAALRPEAFASLLLLDPVIRSRETYTGARQELDIVLRRRNSWASPDEMFERFKNRPPFQAWDPAVLWDYCRFGLLPDGDSEKFVLACPPAVEASIYANHPAKESDIYGEIRQVRIPVRVVRSSGEFDGSNFQASPTTPDLASRFEHGVDMPLSGVSHFIPMEAPELTAKLIEDCLP